MRAVHTVEVIQTRGRCTMNRGQAGEACFDSQRGDEVRANGPSAVSGPHVGPIRIDSPSDLHVTDEAKDDQRPCRRGEKDQVDGRSSAARGGSFRFGIAVEPKSLGQSNRKECAKDWSVMMQVQSCRESNL